jgi:hypothetical protein
MINIFEVFLPQLLRYPNPTDPLNGEAAALLMREPKSYDVKVKGMEQSFSKLMLGRRDWPATDLGQSTSKDMPTRMPRTKPEPRAKTTTT